MNARLIRMEYSINILLFFATLPSVSTDSFYDALKQFETANLVHFANPLSSFICAETETTR